MTFKFDLGVKMLYTLLMIIHVIISTILVLIILAQSSKGAGLDSTLGGTAQNMLGGQAAPKFLQNLTIVFAILFMLSSIMLVKHVSRPQKVSAPVSEKVKSKALKEFKKKLVEKEKVKEAVPLKTEENKVVPIKEAPAKKSVKADSTK